MSDAELLRAQANRIRASGLLGRSPLMQRLFDFLLECTLADKAPKEIEVAMDAFGKGAEFDVSQDAMVRVYVHKLRRKLEEFYAGAGAGEPVHLSIPKGEYRFVVQAPGAPADHAEMARLPVVEGVAEPGLQEPASPDVAASPPRSAMGMRRKWLVLALAASVLLNIAVVMAVYLRPVPPRDELAEVRSEPLWAPLFRDDRPIFIVVGDYYIFGEIGDTMEVQRLVREFTINSRDDLDHYLKLHPEQAERYLDLELAYLPTAAAFALRDLMPVLTAANKRVRVVTMSQLNPAVMKSSHVIYVGYLSGLGRLGDLVFRNSRLSFGETYDEIVDSRTGKRYVSQAGVPYRGSTQIRDYGYLATFAGPEGNRFIVIAGTRDIAAMHMAETLTDRRALEALLAQARSTPAFEALYEVYGIDRLNLDGTLLFTAPLESARIWTGARGPDR